MTGSWVNLKNIVGFITDVSTLIGMKTRVVDASHGWGGVKKGQEGILTDVHWDGIAKANIEGHGFDTSKWKGNYHCFEIFIPNGRTDEEDII